MSHPVTAAPPKPAVPPGASLAYNHAAAHVSPGAFGTCALLRPGLRKPLHEDACEADAAPWDHAPAVTAVTAATGATCANPADPARHPGIDSNPHLGIESALNRGPDSDPRPPTGPAALRCAIAHCGGQSALASAIGLSQSHVWNWLNRRSIPAEHCPAIERATGRAVRCEALRPDVDWAYLRAVCEELAGVREEA